MTTTTPRSSAVDIARGTLANLAERLTTPLLPSDYLDVIVAEDKLAGTTLDSSDPALVSVTQAKEEGGAIFNPGGQCLGAGSVTLTLTGLDGSTRDIALTITE